MMDVCEAVNGCDKRKEDVESIRKKDPDTYERMMVFEECPNFTGDCPIRTNYLIKFFNRGVLVTE